jgi:hypothetical protein
LPELAAAVKQFQSLKPSPELAAAIKQFQSLKPSPEVAAAIQQSLKPLPELVAAIQQLRSFKPSPELAAAIQQFQSFKPSPEVAAAIQQSLKPLPELAAAFKQSKSVFATYGKQMRRAIEPLSQLVVTQEQLRTLAGQSSNFSAALSVVAAGGQFPTALVAEQMIAERAVVSARTEGRLSEIVGTSVTVDVASAADEFSDGKLPSFLDFLERLFSLIRSYVENARSIADLAHLVQVANCALMAAALWFAIQAATSDDIEKQTEAVERQTDVIEQEFQSSRQQFSLKLDEITKAVQQLAADKARSFGPAAVYKVKRAIPVKAKREMKSQTIGWLIIGQAVFVVAREEKWVEIGFVDLTTGQSEKGWVVKKYLRRL